MPRAHTEDEQARITQALLDAGLERFSRAGLLKTTIAELARDAGIGKGSFYKYFDSKEALFFAVQEREEGLFDTELRADLEKAGSGREAVHTLLLAVADRLERHPFLRALLDPEVITALLVRMPPEALQAHREHDRERFLALARDWRDRGWLRPEIAPETVFAVVTATFALSLQRELMGEEEYRRASEEIATAMAGHWC